MAPRTLWQRITGCPVPSYAARPRGILVRHPPIPAVIGDAVHPAERPERAFRFRGFREDVAHVMAVCRRHAPSLTCLKRETLLHFPQHLPTCRRACCAIVRNTTAFPWIHRPVQLRWLRPHSAGSSREQQQKQRGQRRQRHDGFCYWLVLRIAQQVAAFSSKIRRKCVALCVRNDTKGCW